MQETASYASYLMLNVKYFYYDFWKSRNEIVDRLPLMAGENLFKCLKYKIIHFYLKLMSGGPWPVLAITFAYIWFSTVIGPNLMKNREPFDLRPILLFYNVIMMIINGFIFYKAAIFTNFGLYPWTCKLWGTRDNIDENQIKEMLQLSWLFFFSKFLDFIDTIFFVLRFEIVLNFNFWI